MPEDRRRSSDHELGKVQGQIEFVIKLLDESRTERREQYADIADKQDAVLMQVGTMQQQRAASLVEFEELKDWRKVKADPAINRFIATEQQVIGGLKVGKVIGYGTTAAISAGSVAWGPKILAGILAMFTH